MGSRRRNRSLIARNGRDGSEVSSETAPAELPDDPKIELPDDPSVVGEESPFYRVSSDDPDFEETDLLESDPPLDPPDSSGAEVATADEERSLSRSLIGLVKTLLGGASAEPQPPAAVAKHPAQGAPSPTVFPADRGPDSDSFDSVTDEETTRKVQEALARMERGEKPFDD